MPRKKRGMKDDEVTDEDENLEDDDDKEMSLLGTPVRDNHNHDKFSPRKTRSAKRTKKRSRSEKEDQDAEDSPPPQTKKTRTTRTAEAQDDADMEDDDAEHYDDDEESQDESMDDESEEEEEGDDDDRKPPAVNLESTAPAVPAENGGRRNGSHNKRQLESATAAASLSLPTNGDHHPRRRHRYHAVDSSSSPAAAASTRQQKQQRVPRVDKLRMPSKHTPGRKVNETERLKAPPAASDNHQVPTLPPSSRRLRFGGEGEQEPIAAEAMTTAFQQQQQQQERELQEKDILVNGDEMAPVVDEEQIMSLKHRIHQSVSAGLAYVQEVMTELIVPGGGEREQEEVVEEGEEEPAIMSRWIERCKPWMKRYKPWLSYTSTWFVLFLLLQMIFWPIWIHPILSTVVHTSKVALVFYKGILHQSNGTAPSTVVLPTNDSAAILVDKEASAPQAMIEKKKITDERIREKLDELDIVRSEVEEIQQALSYDLKTLEQEMASFQTAVSHQNELVKTAMSSVDSTIQPLEMLLEKGGIPSASDLVSVRESMGAAGKFLLDVSFLESWTWPGVEDCGDESTAATSTIMQQQDVLEEVEQLREEAWRSAEHIIRDVEREALLRRWIRESAEEMAPEITENLKATSSPSAADGSPELEYLEKLIKSRIELERADQTGRIDYASVMNGAAVIRTGDRSTSPSLVDNLPLLNRMAALLSLRFYGYGPEAALTPTHPPGSLGQCWAFEKDRESKYSAFGTLTFRLAEPIYVRRVSIEHPPKEITDQAGTAIRSFRVVGFEDPGAQGKAWSLGSFEYRIDGDIRQEFDIADIVRGEDVPKLHSISVSIDSNWGMEYACLYRVRVFGP